MNQADLPAQDEPEISLVALLTTALREEAGFSEVDAFRIANGMMGRISQRHGGRYFYVGTAATRDYIRRRVREEFNGKNHEELASKYGLGRSTVYRYVA